jgi:hypothetical protein
MSKMPPQRILAFCKFFYLIRMYHYCSNFILKGKNSNFQGENLICQFINSLIYQV